MRDYDGDAEDTGDAERMPEIQWLSPRAYPSRPTEELNILIASDVLRGASPMAACMKHGIAPSRARRWFAWGAEAYAHDAGPADYHAPYVDLFLKVMQAMGHSSVPIQQEIRLLNPQWWLSHHPDTRVEWGGDAEQALLPQVPAEDMVDGGTAVSPPTSPIPSLEPASLRTVLKMLIEAGAGIPLTPHDDTSAGDATDASDEEATGTDGKQPT